MISDFYYKGYGSFVEIAEYRGNSKIVKIPAYINDAFVFCIGPHCFEKNNLVKIIIIPQTVKCISIRAFCSCLNLKYILIPDGVTEIQPLAFADCESLVSITIPNSVEVIYKAFSGCKSLTDIYILNKECNLSLPDIPAQTIIHGYAGSTAEKYARENGNKFEDIKL